MRMRKYQGGGSTPQGDPETIQKLIDAAKSGGVDFIELLLKGGFNIPTLLTDPILSYLRGEGEEAGESAKRGTDMVRDMIASGKLQEQGPIAERVTLRPERAPDSMEPIGMSEVQNKLPRVLKTRRAPDPMKPIGVSEELMKMLRSQGY